VPSTSHHYLPQVYLRRFCPRDNRKLLWEYDKTTGTATESTPKKCGCEDHFHAFKKQDGSLDTDSIEQDLGRIESRADLFYEAIRMGRPLTPEEWAAFFTFAGSMSVRVPAFINNLHNFTSELYSFMFEIMKTNPKLREEWARKGIPPGSLDKVTVAADRDQPLLLSLQSMGTPIQLFSRMNWQFLTATAPDYFITGDVPVFHCAPGRGKAIFPPGLADRDIEITFPLSRTTCAFGTWRPVKALYRLADGPTAELVNARTAAAARRYLFGPQKDSKLFARRPPQAE